MASRSLGFKVRASAEYGLESSLGGRGGICGDGPGSLEFIFDQWSMRYPCMNKLLCLALEYGTILSLGSRSPPHSFEGCRRGQGEEIRWLAVDKNVSCGKKITHG